VRLDAIGSFAHHPFAPAELPRTHLARCTVSFDQWPAAFGLSMRTDAELGGWFFTFDRVRGTVHLSRWPHPLDDFWADLVGRGGEYRAVDGPLVPEARLAVGPGPGRVECSLLVEGPIVELYVDDRVVLTHRIVDRGEQALGAFVVDGSATYELQVTTPG
jgi:hypothetical protein